MAKTKQIEFITTFSKFVSTRLLGEGGSGAHSGEIVHQF
jgi:hypothetical protein